MAATAAAQATSTPTPTNTPLPTSTPLPTDTPTPEPTATPAPTETPTSALPIPALGETNGILTSTLESGWIRYEVTAEQFAIALPPEWLQLDLNPEALADLLGIVGEQNPQFDELFSSQMLRALVAAGVKFYAIDLNPDSLVLDLPTTANIIKVDLGLEIPLDVFVNLNLTQIEDLASPDVPVTHRRVMLTNVEAEEFKYVAEITDITGRNITMMFTQYLLLDETVAYVVTLSAPAELADAYISTFEEIGQSFELTDRVE
jgi:hypothetical protein